MQTLGERIAYYRKAANMTQAELAEACSVTAQAVSKWENNLTAPDIALLPRLAELFHITTDELLGAECRAATAVDPEKLDMNKILLRILVRSGDGDKVNVNLPFALAELLFSNEEAGVNLFGGGSEALKSVDFRQIVALVRRGAMGKLVEIESADGDTVEVWVE